MGAEAGTDGKHADPVMAAPSKQRRHTMKNRIKGPKQTSGKYRKSPSQRAVLVTWASTKLATLDGCSFKPFSTAATDNKAFWKGIPDHHKRIRLTDGGRLISEQARAIFAHAFLSGGEDRPRMAALTTGLFLVLTASNDEKARDAAEMCEGIAVGLTPEQIKQCQDEAEELANDHRDKILKQTFGGNN
jgi:hypothetical protein